MEDFEKKIKDSKECIKKTDLNEGSRIYKLAKNNENNEETKKTSFFNLSKKLIIKYAIFILLFAITFTGGFLIASSLNKGKIVYKNIIGRNDITVNYNQVSDNVAPAKFSNFETKEELIDYLSDSKNTSTLYSSASDRSLTEELDYFHPAVKEYSASTPSIEFSTYTTNTQVENVDEADIVKVSGNHIFYIPKKYNNNKYKLYMFSEVKGNLEITKVISYGTNNEVLKKENGYELVKVNNTYPNDLYVTEKYLIVRIEKVEYKKVQPYYSTYDYSNLCVFEVYDINTLDLVTTIETAGTNVSTRLIDNTLYVVNNYNDYYNNNNSFYYYPYFSLGVDYFYPTIKRIYYFDDIGAKTYVSIYKIKLEDEITIDDLHVITPYVANIYSTEKNIYLIRTYGNKISNEEEYQLLYSNTRVTVINIESDLELSGCFDVKGNINDKYWIDEKDEYIRVVTTGNERKNYYFDKKYVYKTENSLFNYLTIFKKDTEGFVETGSITEGLGKPGETVRSARFNGDIVTIVTFKNTDPIYYVDISNPEKPVITSALEISGYSIYQHPYKDNYVVGFGYEGSGISSGLKITLFDVSDKENIKAVGNSYVMGTRIKEKYTNYYTDLSYFTPEFYSDPKALFVNNELGLFGFSLTGVEYWYNIDKNNYSNIDYEKSTYFSKYIVLTIDENSEDPIKVKEIASIDSPYRMLLENGNYTYNYRQIFERMVFIGNNYYVLGNTEVDCFKKDGNNFIQNNILKLD